MSDLRIGVDIDEVLATFVDDLIPWLEKRHGFSHSKEDYNTYQMKDVWGVSKEKTIAIIEEFIEEKIGELGTVPGSQQGMKSLNKYELMGVTSRSLYTAPKTTPWLEKHYPNHLQHTYYTNTHARSGPKTTKHAICKQNNIHILLEDNAEYALGCAENGVKVFLFDYPWNQEIHHENIQRVQGWLEIPGRVERLKTQILR